MSSESRNDVHVAREIIALVNDIVTQSSCSLLYVGELLFRFKGSYIQSYQQQEIYNYQVKAANAVLKRYLQSNTYITWWSCKGATFSQQAAMHDDRVHFNYSLGIFKYYKAIWGALVHGLNHL